MISHSIDVNERSTWASTKRIQRNEKNRAKGFTAALAKAAAASSPVWPEEEAAAEEEAGEVTLEVGRARKMACEGEAATRRETSSSLGGSRRRRCVMRRCGLPCSSRSSTSATAASPAVRCSLAGKNEFFSTSAPVHVLGHRREISVSDRYVYNENNSKSFHETDPMFERSTAVEFGYIIHGIHHPAAYIFIPNFYIIKSSGYIIQPF